MVKRGVALGIVLPPCRSDTDRHHHYARPNLILGKSRCFCTLPYNSQRTSRMNRFSIGNDVLVSDKIASEYAGSRGMVVAVESRQTSLIQLTEYEVEFKDGKRRRFLDYQ